MAMQHSRISTAMHTDVKRGASAAIEAARRRALALTLPRMIRTYPRHSRRSHGSEGAVKRRRGAGAGAVVAGGRVDYVQRRRRVAR